MDIWGILGIEPTREIAKIKKAYAQQLKKHHPEDDPQRFQQLREAYESALTIAKFLNANSKVPPAPGEGVMDTTTGTENAVFDKFHSIYWQIDAEIHGNEASPPLPSQTDAGDDRTSELLNVRDVKVQFISKLAQLYDDFFARIDLENWKALFDCDLMWNINTRNVLSYELLDFLAEHHHLPSEIWKFVDDYFGWSQQKDTYHSRVPEPLIDFIVRQITNPSIPRYSDIKFIEGYDYERFLDSREIALYSPIKDLLGEAPQYYLAHVDTVYPDDPYLSSILGSYFYLTKDYPKAKSNLEKAIQYDPMDDRLPVLLERVNKEFKVNLGWKFIKKPWSLDLLKQYYRFVKEIRAQKKASLEPVSLEILRRKRVSAGIFGLMAFLFIFMALRVQFTDTKNNSTDSQIFIDDMVPIELSETNIDQVQQWRKVQVQFDNVTCLELRSIDIPNIKDHNYDRAFIHYPYEPSDSEKLYYPTWVAIGKLKQKEIIFVKRSESLKKECQGNSLSFTGVMYDLDSPLMLATVKNELIRLNAPAEVAANLVITKYFVADEKYERKGTTKPAKPLNPVVVYLGLALIFGVCFFWTIRSTVSLQKG